MTSGTDGLTVERRPSVQYLRECFDFRDGVLYWKERPESHFQSRAVWLMFLKKHAGKPAGKLGSTGYVTVGLRVNGEAISMAAHRIVWAMHYGSWPTLDLDHIDRVRNNNRIENLREVTPAENSQNSSWKCVHPYVHPARKGQYQAQVKIGRNQVHIGVFESERAAHEHRQMVLAEMEKLARRLAKKSKIGRVDGETVAREAAAPSPVNPPEFQEATWGFDSVMRPCKSPAISEYSFRQWAKDVGIVLADEAATPQAPASEVEKDAARYRWLRDENNGDSDITPFFAGQGLDEAIDAAMAVSAPAQQTKE